MLQSNSLRASLEAKFIICPLCLLLEQPKSPAAPTLNSTVLCPSTAEGPAISICPLRAAAALPVCLCAEQAAQEQQGLAPPGTRTEGMHRQGECKCDTLGFAVTWSSGHFHITESKNHDGIF